MSRHLPAILEQHAEEAAFLWILRDDAVAQPHYDLRDLARLDNRVEAHLDGLRIAEDAGWDCVQAGFKWEEPGEIFAGAVIALESGGADCIDQVVTLGTSSRERARGLVSAFGWVPFERIEPTIRRLLASSSPGVRRAAIAACAVHRRDPGPSLSQALSDPDSELRSRACLAVGELGRADLLGALAALMNDKDPACRFAAAWSLALQSKDPNAQGMLQRIAEDGGPRSLQAATTLVRRLNPAAATAWGKSRPSRMAIAVAGAIGDPDAIPWLLELLGTPALARAAGEAIMFLTGLDLAYLDLEQDAPRDFKAGPTEDPKDEDVAMDPDENLPWPSSGKMEKWWKENAARFPRGVRHLLGKPIAAESLREALAKGGQRQRAAAAIELTMRNPGHPLYEVRVPGFRQRPS